MGTTARIERLLNVIQAKPLNSTYLSTNVPRTVFKKNNIFDKYLLK